jgi:Ca2+-binding EF-hand superfamily protein
MQKELWQKLTGFGLGAILALGAPAAAFAGGSAEEKFNKFDTNGDGKISAAENEAGWRKSFQKMDTNSDGKVTAAELGAAQSAHGKKGDATQRIEKMDTNGDGSISADEYAAGKKEKFNAWDTNHDGSLSKDELGAGLAAKKESK